MTSADLPCDVRESDLEPKTCEHCAYLEDLLREALEYLEEYEDDSFGDMDTGTPTTEWRRKLLNLIDRINAEV